MDNVRQEILDFVKREFIGPSNLLVQENGNEYLVNDSPLARYSCAILFPKATDIDHSADNSEENHVADDTSKQNLADKKNFFEEKESSNTEEVEELMSLSNAFKQSAASITVAVDKKSVLTVAVRCAKYTFQTILTGEKEEKVFLRVPFSYEIDISFEQLPKALCKPSPISNFLGDGLSFLVTRRYSIVDAEVFTLTLLNEHVSNEREKDYQNSFFQCEFSVKSTIAFHVLTDIERECPDEDYLQNELLYRDVRRYAIGHGCAPLWDPNAPEVTKVECSFMPTIETTTVTSNTFPDISLSMEMFSKENEPDTLLTLTRLSDRYEEWINNIGKAKFNDRKGTTARRNYENCLVCLNRIREGISLIKANPTARKAFEVMNKAMLLQQLHYNLPLRKWTCCNGAYALENQDFPLPRLEDKNTWYGEINKYGYWRPFQIAFILLNIKSMVEKDCLERDYVELIWFPTGGGKTEAYLGLSAFTIFLRRLMNPNDSGTAIITRYTLRLLTSQQYERAASLVCACESIRASDEKLYGKERITIGLWVGGESTPNKVSDAITALNKMYHDSNENPFVIRKCPWCGAEMGIIEKKGSSLPRVVKGYSKKSHPSHFYFECPNEKCDFSHKELPLLVIDEDIYLNPPTLLIGTVDKFAILPFRYEGQRIFGIKNGFRFSSIDLIIQDELHLISGPLGSTVGLYESLVDFLATDKSNPIHPKIIASTATISCAKEQCSTLFARKTSQVNIFPPSGIDAGETFFSKVGKIDNGRCFVGIHAPASTSPSTTSIRLFASLLSSGTRTDCSNKQRDSYWTIIGYFNSLSELGKAATWINSDIPEYMKTINNRLHDGKARYLDNSIELTSRIENDKIPAYLNQLQISADFDENGRLNKDSREAVDICLATNMISVGLDVQRLGLMVVTGQPKMASEYIQATSRVGRSANQGLVFVIFNPLKPRDISIFENFSFFHSRIQTYVEPTSVTPFSPQLRERALAAVLGGFIRLSLCQSEKDDPSKYYYPNPKMDSFVDSLIKRVEVSEPEEADDTRKQIKEILDKWRRQQPKKFNPSLFLRELTSNEEIAMFFHNSCSFVDDLWRKRSFGIPTSMRNVDKDCLGNVISDYGTEVTDE